jgi:hypothetical protein
LVAQQISDSDENDEPDPFDVKLSTQVRSLVCRRIDRIYEDEAFPLDANEVGTFLRLLFPEDYAEPAAKPTATVTPPGSSQRAMVYANRAHSGRSIFHPDDAEAVHDDRAGLIPMDGQTPFNNGPRGERANRVKGWA